MSPSFTRVSIVTMTVVALFGVSVRSQSARSTERRLSALEQEIAALRRQLDELGKLVAKPEPPPRQTFEKVSGVYLSQTSSLAMLGSPTASVALLEFTDLQCPYCGRFEKATFPDIDTRLIRTGRIKYVLRHFPIEEIHPFALKAAESVVCAGDQGKDWELRHALFAHQQALSPPDLIRHGQLIGIDMARFRSCLDDKQLLRIRQDIAEGVRLGVDSTPTFFVGRISADGTVQIKLRITGALPFDVFRDAVDDVARDKD
jgi:protein-disulfide isomerase